MALRDLYIALVYAGFFLVGITTPFVLTLGYLWVDTFYPQALSYWVGQLQSSMVIGVAAMLGYILLDRRSPPRFSLHTAIMLLFAAWITLTLTWAERPDSGWNKWDWAFKVVVFAAFLPLVLRSRVQIEAFLQVFVFSAMLHMIAVGSKTLLSGSSYGRQLDVIAGNAGLTESSTLAALSIAIIPILLYLRNHSVLVPKSRLRDVLYLSLVPIAVFAAMGTYARTALVGFLVVGLFMWIQSRRKVIFTLCAVAVVAVVLVRTAESWNERIATTANIEEDTTNTRVLVWLWTIQYALANPLGGGFQSYEINRIVYPGPNGEEPRVEYGRAFHNMFMEVLGEQGFPGLAMFLALQGMSLWYMRSVSRRTRGKPHLAWAHDLAQTLMTSLLTMMACGCFIGIAFQAFVWYLMTLPVCLNAYLYRVEQLEAGTDKPLPWAALRNPRPALPAPARAMR